MISSFPPMSMSRPVAMKFGNQSVSDADKLKTLFPNGNADFLTRLTQFAVKLDDAGKQTLFNELEKLGKLANKTEFFNADFARLELASLIVETRWPAEFSPKDILDDALHVSRRRNRERGHEDHDNFGVQFLVGQARQEVTAMKAAEKLTDLGVSPEIVEATRKDIAKDLSYVGEALWRSIEASSHPASEE